MTRRGQDAGRLASIGFMAASEYKASNANRQDMHLATGKAIGIQLNTSYGMSSNTGYLRLRETNTSRSAKDGGTKIFYRNRLKQGSNSGPDQTKRDSPKLDPDAEGGA